MYFFGSHDLTSLPYCLLDSILPAPAFRPRPRPPTCTITSSPPPSFSSSSSSSCLLLILGGGRGPPRDGKDLQFLQQMLHAGQERLVVVKLARGDLAEVHEGLDELDKDHFREVAVGGRWRRCVCVCVCECVCVCLCV